MALASRLRSRFARPRSRFRRPSRVGAPAVTELSGTSPDGAPMQVTLGDRRTVMFFLTSSCYGCRPVWEGFGARSVAPGRVTPKEAPGDARVILVTPSPSTESAKEVAALAPDGIDVLMSSEAWHAFGVNAAPWFVVVAGGGLIAAEGAAPAAWKRIQALVGAGPG